MIMACAWCKKEIDTGRELSEQEYEAASHGICPEDRAIFFPETITEAINDSGERQQTAPVHT